MVAIEILMVIIGLGAVIISFRLSDDSRENDDNKTEIDSVEIEQKIREAVKKTEDEILSKADEKFSQISNDKILGFSEYSDEVFNKIEKNHEETVFLYNMLTEKEKEIQKLIHSVDVTNADLRNESAKAYQKIKKHLSEIDGVLKQVEIENARSAISDDSNDDVNSLISDISTVSKPIVEERLMSTEVKDKDLHRELNDMSVRTQMRGSAVLNDAEMKAIAKITDSREEYISHGENIFDEDKNEGSKMNSNSEIIALYKKGRSILEISKMLSIGQGEVKLVIDLYNAR